ncbi:MAG TPA: biotin--[acetyl-CoA-carboxylase] ligase [Blastocatellia bacterium]|nr:biotin--[acetyl-CoA-carboxylase] ligase [Blastocatellia bacterium]
MASLGTPLLRFDSVPSTNDLARQMAIEGAAEGTAILALHQTAGRGRQGKHWASPPGQGLYVSVVLRPCIKPAALPILTLGAAVAVADTLIGTLGLAPDIKWPNDVMAGGRKVCGILIESGIESGRTLYAVLGVGLNVSQREFPEELRGIATSLAIESGVPATPDEVLPALLERLEYWYRISLSAPARVLERWTSLSSYAMDCRVRIVSSEEVFEGVTRGITPAGYLIVEGADGRRREFATGEVSLRKQD